jgi:hypothetical protein
MTCSCPAPCRTAGVSPLQPYCKLRRWRCIWPPPPPGSDCAVTLVPPSAPSLSPLGGSTQLHPTPSKDVSLSTLRPPWAPWSLVLRTRIGAMNSAFGRLRVSTVQQPTLRPSTQRVHPLATIVPQHRARPLRHLAFANGSGRRRRQRRRNGSSDRTSIVDTQPPVDELVSRPLPAGFQVAIPVTFPPPPP